MATSVAAPSLHIVMLLHTYLPESFGGAEQQCRKLSAELVHRGHRVTILAPRLKPGTPKREVVNGVTIQRITLHALPNLGGRYFASFLKWSAEIIFWIFRNRADIDVVHVFHGRLHSVPAVIGGRLAGVPVLIKLGRGGDRFDLTTLNAKRVYGKFFARLVRRYATGYIANSREIVNNLKDWNIPDDRIHAIVNGVELPQVEPRPAGRWESGAPRVYVFLGRLDREKNVDRLIEAFAGLPGQFNVRLDIVGDGDLRPELDELARARGVDARVRFCGSTGDVGAYLRQADFFVLASQSEGMSNALLEAMSYGVVPIVSRVSGVEDLVEHGVHGFLFETDNLAGCVAQLERSARLPEHAYNRMSAAARAHVAAHFGMPHIAEQHLNLYARLSGKADPRLIAEAKPNWAPE